MHPPPYRPARLPLCPAHFGVATNYIVSPKNRSPNNRRSSVYSILLTGYTVKKSTVNQPHLQTLRIVNIALILRFRILKQIITFHRHRIMKINRPSFRSLNNDPYGINKSLLHLTYLYFAPASNFLKIYLDNFFRKFNKFVKSRDCCGCLSCNCQERWKRNFFITYIEKEKLYLRL